MVNDMAKRRISKASKKRLIFWGIPCVIIIFYFIFTLFYSAYELYSLNVEKRHLEKNYVKLQEKAEDLKIDIEKLNDDKYLADYVREHYLYSKDNEYILQLNEDIDDIKDIDDIDDNLKIINIKINRNYMLIALSIITILMFIYILSKGKRKKKSKKRNKN